MQGSPCSCRWGQVLRFSACCTPGPNPPHHPPFSGGQTLGQKHEKACSWMPVMESLPWAAYLSTCCPGHTGHGRGHVWCRLLAAHGRWAGPALAGGVASVCRVMTWFSETKQRKCESAVPVGVLGLPLSAEAGCFCAFRQAAPAPAWLVPPSAPWSCWEEHWSGDARASHNSYSDKVFLCRYSPDKRLLEAPLLQDLLLRSNLLLSLAGAAPLCLQASSQSHICSACISQLPSSRSPQQLLELSAHVLTQPTAEQHCSLHLALRCTSEPGGDELAQTCGACSGQLHHSCRHPCTSSDLLSHITVITAHTCAPLMQAPLHQLKTCCPMLL